MGKNICALGAELTRELEDEVAQMFVNQTLLCAFCSCPFFFNLAKWKQTHLQSVFSHLSMLEMANEGVQSHTNGLCLAQEMAIFVFTAGGKFSKPGGWTSLCPTVDGPLCRAADSHSPGDGNAAFQGSYRQGHKGVIRGVPAWEFWQPF